MLSWAIRRISWGQKQFQISHGKWAMLESLKFYSICNLREYANLAVFSIHSLSSAQTFWDLHQLLLEINIHWSVSCSHSTVRDLSPHCIVDLDCLSPRQHQLPEGQGQPWKAVLVEFLCHLMLDNIPISIYFHWKRPQKHLTFSLLNLDTVNHKNFSGHLLFVIFVLWFSAQIKQTDKKYCFKGVLCWNIWNNN